MNRNSFFFAGIATLAMFASACSQSSSPTAPGNSSIGGTSGQPGLLAKLSEPAAYVDPIDNSNYRFVFSAYASGFADSEPMRATRVIESVEFEVHAASGAIIDREISREIITTGIRSADDSGSLTVTADAMWPISANVSRGSYVLAIVRGHNGEVLVRRAELPLGGQ